MSLKPFQRLVRRGDVFYFRRRVPMSYLPFFSFGAVVISLKTKDLTLALVRWAKVNRIVEQLFQMIDEQGNLDQAKLKRHFHAELKEALGLGAGNVPIPKSSHWSEALAQEIMANEDGELFDLGLDYVINERDQSGNSEWDKLSQKHYSSIGLLVAKSALEYLRQYKHYSGQGRYAPAFDAYFADILGSQDAAGTAVVSQVANPSRTNIPAIQAPPDPSYSLKTVFEGFQNEEGASWGKRRYKFEEAFRIMSDLYGEDTDIRHISVENAREVKTLLASMPVRASNQKKYKGLSLKDQITLAKSHGDETIAAGSIKDKLKNISLWFQWALRNKYISENHFHGLTVKDQRGQRKDSVPYTEKELKTIFSAPRFSGMLSDRKWMEQGRLINKDIDYWAPLIAIYHGMRIEEICQLRVKHIVKKDDFWVFDLKTDSELRIKTSASRRFVPLHKVVLKDWQFEDWLKTRKAKLKSDDLIFEGVELRPDGTYSSAFSKRFGRFLETLDLKGEGRCFHSFRHNMADAMRTARIEEPILKTILGHDLGDVTSQYGAGYRAQVDILKAEIDKVKYAFKPPKI